MIWLFLILGASTLVVLCVAIALFMHLRHNLHKAHATQDAVSLRTETERPMDGTDR